MPQHRDVQGCGTRRGGKIRGARRDVHTCFTVRDEHQVLVDGDRVRHDHRRSQSEGGRVGAGHRPDDQTVVETHHQDAVGTPSDESFAAEDFDGRLRLGDIGSGEREFVEKVHRSTGKDALLEDGNPSGRPLYHHDPTIVRVVRHPTGVGEGVLAQGGHVGRVERV